MEKLWGITVNKYHVCIYNDQIAVVYDYREIAEQLLAIFQAQPTLLVDHSKEIMEFLINLRTLKSGGKDCYTNLVGDSYFHEHGMVQLVVVVM